MYQDINIEHKASFSASDISSRTGGGGGGMVGNLWNKKTLINFAAIEMF